VSSFDFAPDGRSIVLARGMAFTGGKPTLLARDAGYARWRS
jgi:hypothetical protein